MRETILFLYIHTYLPLRRGWLLFYQKCNGLTIHERGLRNTDTTSMDGAFHYTSDRDGRVFIVVTERSYPPRIAYQCLEELQNEVHISYILLLYASYPGNHPKKQRKTKEVPPRSPPPALRHFSHKYWWWWGCNGCVLMCIYVYGLFCLFYVVWWWW